MKIHAILLAAGASSRMQGVDKMLLEHGSETLLERVTKTALSSDVTRVHVVLPPDNAGRLAALLGLDVDVIIATECADGMGASLRAGIMQLPDDCDAVVVLLADMPDISSADINALIAAFEPDISHDICRAVTVSSRKGHPVLFAARFFEALRRLDGDIGAREILRRESAVCVDVQTTGEGAVSDLDTPEDWRNWLESR